MSRARQSSVGIIGALSALMTPVPALAEGGLNLFDFSNEASHPLVALVINFLILAGIVYLILRKPLGKRFRNRKADLVQAIEEARAAKSEAEAVAVKAREKMAAIDAEMARLREEIIGAGEAESAQLVGEAEARSKRLVEDTRALVDSEVARIAQGIREEVVAEIIAEARRLIRDRITAADHARLYDEYLNEMAEVNDASLDKR